VVGPNMPGQSPGQQSLQRLQKQQQEQLQRQQERQRQAGWAASQRKIEDTRRPRRGRGELDEAWTPEPLDRLGFFRRLLRRLLTFGFFVVSVWIAAAAFVSWSDGYTGDAVFAGMVALAGFLLTARIRKWGRS